MTSFTVVRTIGTAGFYSTPASWEADAPADYTTAEKSACGSIAGTFTQNESLAFVGSGATGKYLDGATGSFVAYALTAGNPAAGDVVTGLSSGAVCTLSSSTPTNVGCIWQGNINGAGDAFTGTTTRLTIAGGVDSATAYAFFTTGAGASFRDNANVQTNALRFSSLNGCYLTNSGNNYQPVVENQQIWTRISNQQIYQSGSGRALVHTGVDASLWVKDCILQALGDYVYLSSSRNNNIFTNVLFVLQQSGGTGIVYPASSNATVNFYNCGFIVPNDLTKATYAFDSVGYSDFTTKNCYFFGINNIKNAGNGHHSGGYSNLSGTTGITQVTYAAGIFGNGTTSITSTTMDQRTRSGGAINAVVTADTTNAPNDIVGTLRPTGANASDAGPWQLVSAGGTTVNVPAAAITFTGKFPVVNRTQSIRPPTAAITFAANAPVVTRGNNQRVTVPAAGITFAAQAPVVNRKQSVRPPVAGITFTAYPPSIGQGHSIVAPAASILFTPNAPVINRTQSVKPPAAAITFIANPPVITQSSPTPPVVAYGGGGAQGGGKRSLPDLDKLSVFEKLTRRKKGQTIQQALKELDDPQVESTTVEEVAQAAEAVVTKPAESPEYIKLSEQVASMRLEIDTLREAMKPAPLPDTTEDDAEILSIIVGII